MAEIESGETYSGIKFKGLYNQVTEDLKSVLNSKYRIAKQKKPANKACSRQWELVAIFRQISGFEFFLLSSETLTPPRRR
ncbi:MAG: hypothetical protein IH586_23200 [Anaerolineaceae bacterium]|nr:hypothetical protein [Anaerolineaceae bacterium]